MLKNLGHILFQSHDDGTELGRGNTRLKRAFLSALSGGLAKITSLVVIFFTVRWGVDYLGEERYGLWMTITSLIALIGLADLGINNIIVNITSDASGKDEVEAVKKELSNAIAIMIIISIAIIMISIIGYHAVDWGALFGLKSKLAISEAAPSVMIFAILYALTLPSTVVQKILIGLQKGWIANIWMGTSQLAGLISLWYAISNQLGLPYLILSILAPALIVNIGGTLLFFNLRKDLTPKISSISERNIKSLILSGGLFFLIQIMAMAGNASDNIIIAYFIGADKVAEYTICQRLATIMAFYQFFISALWPFGESLSRGDNEWASKTFYNGTYISLAFSLTVAIAYFNFGGYLINVWTNGNVDPNIELIIGFCFFIVMSSLSGMVSALMSTTGMLKSLAVIYTSASIFSIALKIILLKYFESTLSVVFANVVAYTFLFIAPAYLIIKKKLNESINPRPHS